MEVLREPGWAETEIFQKPASRGITVRLRRERGEGVERKTLLQRERLPRCIATVQTTRRVLAPRNSTNDVRADPWRDLDIGAGGDRGQET